MGISPKKVGDSTLQAGWETLILPESVKEQLKMACGAIRTAATNRVPGAAVPHILLYGPPGTGKAQLARKLANEANVAFLNANPGELKAAMIGQAASRVRDLFQRARSVAPCIVCFDELESATPRRNSPKADPSTGDIVSQMLQEMSSAQMSACLVSVVAASNLPLEIDEAIKSRFDLQILIPLPDENDRRQILRSLISQRPITPGLEIDQVSAEIAAATHGKSSRDLAILVDRALQRGLIRSASHNDLGLTRDDLLAQLPQEKPPTQV